MKRDEDFRVCIGQFPNPFDTETRYHVALPCGDTKTIGLSAHRKKRVKGFTFLERAEELVTGVRRITGYKVRHDGDIRQGYTIYKQGERPAMSGAMEMLPEEFDKAYNEVKKIQEETAA